MKNKKKVLLEALAGSVEMLNSLSELSDGVDIYDETGHVEYRVPPSGHWEYKRIYGCL